MAYLWSAWHKGLLSGKALGEACVRVTNECASKRKCESVLVGVSLCVCVSVNACEINCVSFGTFATWGVATHIEFATTLATRI